MNPVYPKRRFSLAAVFLVLTCFLASRLAAQQTHISYFTPQRASMGATVSIHGSGLTGTSYVSFGGYSALSFTVYQDTMVTAVVGHGGNGYVLVSGTNGMDSLAGFSFSTSDSPLIYSYVPKSGSPGTVVTISGTRLTGSTAVSFGGTAAASFTVVSDSVIRATVGYGSTGNVSVNTPFGASSATGFTYIPPAGATHISYFTPTTGKTGNLVQIHGNYFSGTSGVKFGGVDAQSFAVVSDTLINAAIGTGASGQVWVSGVNAPDSLAGFVYQDTTTVTAHTVIHSFTPASGMTGDTIFIHGVAFTGTSVVRFGGVNAASFTVLSDTLIDARVGAGASGLVFVSGTHGQDSLGGFTYVTSAGAPQIMSIKPAYGNPGSVITINGSHFTGATAVSFGGTPAASFSVLSDAQISAVVGSGSSGSVTVTTPSGSASLPGFTYIGPPAAHIRYFTPTRATTGMTVQIHGNYFTGTTAVRFGGVDASSFFVANDTLIDAVVGTGASGQVWVSTPNGPDSLGGFMFVDSTVIHTVMNSFSPDSARTGATVQIYGSGLTTVNVVRFGGVNAQSFTIVSDSLINAVVGTGKSGLVFISGPDGLDSLPGFVFIDTMTHDTTKPHVFGLVSLTIGPAGYRPQLQWQTVYDESISAYEVEQGTDTAHFNPVGVVGSLRKDSASYTFTDSVDRTGLNYYYLKMIDTAGHISSSQIVAIKMPMVVSTLSGFPNPAVGSLYVPMPVSPQTSKITVTDMSGNVVRTIIVPPNSGPVRVDLHGLNKGVYKIVWSNGATSAYQTVLVWN